MMNEHSVITGHVVNSASVGRREAKNPLTRSWWRSVGLSSPTMAPVSSRIFLIQMSLQRVYRVQGLFGSLELQPLEGRPGRMARSLTFRAQQQLDAALEGLGLCQTVRFAISHQSELCFGAQARRDSHTVVP